MRDSSSKRAWARAAGRRTRKKNEESSNARRTVLPWSVRQVTAARSSGRDGVPRGEWRRQGRDRADPALASRDAPTLCTPKREEPSMSQNPPLALTELGQSIWIDHLDRGRIASGEVRAHIRNDGLRGMTSNPTIFEQSISGSRDYDAPIRALARRGRSPAEIYDAVTIEEIGRANV